MNEFKCFYFLALTLSFILKYHSIGTNADKAFFTKNSFNPNHLSSDSLESFNLDTANIPEQITNLNNINEILNVLASRKYRLCKASVLFDPVKRVYLFRNPAGKQSSSGSGSLKDYISVKCRDFTSRIVSNSSQRFFVGFKDIEQILDNNEDSILTEGIHELTDLRKGLEFSLFPVKFYKSLPEMSYSYQKEQICFDSLKVLGIDKNNYDYYILSALDKHRIINCEGYDINKKYNLNNFIRYSSYCDEFCAEDFIYFSNELSKCKCDFYREVDEVIKSKHYHSNGKSFNETDQRWQYTRKLDQYEIFANPSEITEKLIKYEEQNKPHIRYYFNLFTIFITFQVLYAFYFAKNNLVIKFIIIFYITLVCMIYIPYRLLQSSPLISFSYDILFKASEIISDIYPIFLLLVVACESENPLGENPQMHVCDDTLKLSFIILMNSCDHILREMRVNEIEILIRLILIIASTVVNFKGYIQFYTLNVRIKNIFELLSRLSLFLVQCNIIPDFSVPCFIILGKPRESYITSDHLLFQTNYIKLKPFYDKLYENWFMEALNFHKFKDIILFLKLIRYSMVILIMSTSTLNHTNEGIKQVFGYLTELKFGRIIEWYAKLGYYNLTNVKFTTQVDLICSPFHRNIKESFHLPILFAFTVNNVVVTKECLKILLVHFVVGLVYILLNDELCSSGNQRNRERPHPLRRIFHSSMNIQDGIGQQLQTNVRNLNNNNNLNGQ